MMADMESRYYLVQEEITKVIKHHYTSFEELVNYVK